MATASKAGRNVAVRNGGDQIHNPVDEMRAGNDIQAIIGAPIYDSPYKFWTHGIHYLKVRAIGLQANSTETISAGVAVAIGSKVRVERIFMQSEMRERGYQRLPRRAGRSCHSQ